MRDIGHLRGKDISVYVVFERHLADIRTRLNAWKDCYKNNIVLDLQVLPDSDGWTLVIKYI